MPSTPATLSSTAHERAELRRELGRAARILGGALLLLWGVFVVNLLLFGGDLLALGVLPRTIAGLRGILFMPLLHGSLAHLVGNSLGILLVGTLVMFREERHFWAVTAIGALVGGLGTWLFGRPAVHIGASGLVFAYLGYLLLAGLFERRIGSVILSSVAAVLYGGMLVGLLPGTPGVSWEGHLFGFVGGVVAARVLARRGVAGRGSGGAR